MKEFYLPEILRNKYWRLCLSGGETAAFVVLDSILRLIPGVLGNDKSIDDESFKMDC